MDPASEHSWNLFQYIRELLTAPEKHTRDWSEAECHNIQNSSLYRLPAELLGIIHEYLTPNDSFALSLTCARFYFSTILAGVQRDLKSTKMGQFIVKCMLEGVGEIKEYCCRGCLTTHPFSHFSKDELEKRHAERYCLRTKKILALGAFGSHPKSFNKIQAIRKERELEENLDIPQKNSFWEFFSSPKVSIVTGIRLFPERQKVSVEQFAELCQKLNYPVCPHMTTADKRIVHLYVPDYHYAGESGIPNPFLEHYVRNGRGVKCRVCNTIVTLDTSNPNGKPMACAIIFIRPVGRLISPLEPAWLASTSSEGSLLSRERERQVYDAAHSFYSATQAPIAGTAIESNIDFIPLSLPTSSLMARLGVTIWSAVSSCISERHHRKSGHIHRITFTDHLCRLTPIFKSEREGRRS
ncbi:F-box domain-containing protein [Trichophyton interdigitale]|uniref:F-box domain-containing protein n=1 Tax=Trichophyton interdigitale TaxID=101480 RepID=A0A9P4YMG0_9EURO|nr:F-box domain-containing protein [Trichophyton interdigitale]KAF3900123.1 F-box domain-containing protein [Trichophyton interdigitale]KAG8211195.1 F-box domain-containing protein [Trichophyton interdigitale]